MMALPKAPTSAQQTELVKKILTGFLTFSCHVCWWDMFALLKQVKTAVSPHEKFDECAPAGVKVLTACVLKLENGFRFRWGVRWGTRVAGNGLRLKGTDGCPSLLGLSQGVGVAWGSDAVCYHLLFREIGP